jgi:GMC oxidoreductase
VGRYWTEHNVFTIGDFLLFEKDAFKTKTRVSPLGVESMRIFVGPSKRFLEQQSVLNCGLRLRPIYERFGARKYLAKLLCTTPDLSNALLEPFGERLICAGKIRAAWEQFPDIDNRVALSTERDSFGLSRCELHWRKTIRDKFAPRKAALALGKYMAEKDIGRIKLAPWLLRDDDMFPTNDEIASNHHIGGTRMANIEHDGVVDSNCRVFGTSNLYVAGSSVFPSGGHANPTFTIVQLALRLADHLSNLSLQI